MPKTNKIVACIDHANHRTEYQLLTNILIDKGNERTLGDVIKQHDINSQDIVKLIKANNSNADVIDSLINVIKLLVELLKDVLTEDDIKKLETIINERGNL